MLTFQSAKIFSGSFEFILQAAFTAASPIDPAVDAVSISLGSWGAAPTPFVLVSPGQWSFSGAFPDGSHGGARFILQGDGRYMLVVTAFKFNIGVTPPASLSLAVGGQSGSTTAVA